MSLQQLIDDRDALDLAIARGLAEQRAAGIAAINELISLHGLTSADINVTVKRPGSAPRPVKKPIGVAKYRHPTTGAGWVGRGKRPAWLATAIADGSKLADFAVAA